MLASKQKNSQDRHEEKAKGNTRDRGHIRYHCYACSICSIQYRVISGSIVKKKKVEGLPS
jgi:hypothetical protein